MKPGPRYDVVEIRVRPLLRRRSAAPAVTREKMLAVNSVVTRARWALLLNMHFSLAHFGPAKTCFQATPRLALASTVPKLQDAIKATEHRRMQRISSTHMPSIERIHTCLTHLRMLGSDKPRLNPALWPLPSRTTLGQRLLGRPPLHGGGQKRSRRSSAATGTAAEPASGDNFAQARLPNLKPDVSLYEVIPRF